MRRMFISFVACTWCLGIIELSAQEKNKAPEKDAVPEKNKATEKDKAPEKNASPEKKASRIPGFGEILDPAGDCKFVEKDGKLSITVPGKLHDLNPAPNKNMAAPRVFHEIESDFEYELRTHKFEMPKAQSFANKDNPISFVSSTLLIWVDKENYLRIDRSANGDVGSEYTAVHFFSKGEPISSPSIEILGEDVWYRVARKKGTLFVSISDNGKDWSDIEFEGVNIALPDKVKIGVMVINATNREIVHDFSELKFTKPK